MMLFRRMLLITISVILFTVASVCAALDRVAIVSSPPHDDTRVSVLPVYAVTGDDSSAAIVTETLIRTLSRMEYIRVIPLTLTIETAQVYYPDFFSVKPDDLSYAPENIKVYGQLDIQEKQTISTALTAGYIIDGVFIHEESGSRILIDVFSQPDGSVVESFDASIDPGGSIFEASQKVGRELDNFFFQRYADDLILDVLNTVTAQRISVEQAAKRFEAWQQRYASNPLLSAGAMIIASQQKDGADAVIRAGEAWFEHTEFVSDRQIRFFQSININPFLVLGKAYKSTGNLTAADRVFARGAGTFPFNTPELSIEYASCLRAQGKHTQSDAVLNRR